VVVLVVGRAMEVVVVQVDIEHLLEHLVKIHLLSLHLLFQLELITQ
jgi:hypothetical protein